MRRHEPKKAPSSLSSTNLTYLRHLLTLSCVLRAFVGVGVGEPIDQVLLVPPSGELPASSLVDEVRLTPGAVVDLRRGPTMEALLSPSRS